MRARDPLAMAVCLAWLGTSGCAHNTAPPGWLPDANAASTRVLGGWVTVDRGKHERPRAIEGELIAVQSDSLFVLSDGTLVGLDRAGTRKVTLTGYAIDLGGLRGWTVAGILSTASHGYFAALTLPLWIVTGTISTAAASHAPELKYPGKEWTSLALYARFPQGIPATLDWRLLERK